MAPSNLPIDIKDEMKSEIDAETLVGQGGKEVKCFSNYQDTSFDMEEVNESEEVDIVGCRDPVDARFGKVDDDPNATECSSSFSGSVSGAEDGSSLSGDEVESRFRDDNAMGLNWFEGYDSLFRRKKKLTAHWRSHVRHITWRCKWMELRMREFQSQASKYDRELASLDRAKQLKLGSTSEDCDMRSFPFDGSSYGKKVMKRKKRKRKEDEVDLPSYMSHHNLFSYYENKRSGANCASVDDDSGLQVFSADVNNTADLDIKYARPSRASRDYESSLEKVFCEIETMQCRVKKLKIRLDELLTVNAGKFCSIEDLSLLVPSDLPSSLVRTPTSSPPHEKTKPVGALYTPQSISECDVGDLGVPESAIASDGHGTGVPENAVASDGHGTAPEPRESTLGRSTPVEGHLDQLHIGISCKDMVDEVLIDTQTAGKGSDDIEKTSGPPRDKPQEVKEEKEIVDPQSAIPASKPEVNENANGTQEQSVLKSCLASDFLVPKNKRKRVQRKPRLGAWKAAKISKRRSLGKSDK